MFYTVSMLERIGANMNGEHALFAPSPFARESLIYLYETAVQEIPSRKKVCQPAAEGYLAGLVLAGDTEIASPAGTSMHVAEGDYFWLDCRTEHVFFSANPFRFRAVRFGGGSASGFYRRQSEKNGLCGAAPATLGEQLSAIAAAAQRTDGARDFELCKLLCALVCDLSACAAEPNCGAPVPAYLSALLRYLDENFREELSLESLAERFHVNKYHLSHTFKKHVGIGYREYLVKLRIEYAARELRHTERSVAVIAENAGFPSAGYLTNAFKKNKQITPLAYRRQFR